MSDLSTITQADPLREALKFLTDALKEASSRCDITGELELALYKAETALAQSPAPQSEEIEMRLRRQMLDISEHAGAHLCRAEKAEKELAELKAAPIPSDRAGREEEIARECVNRFLPYDIAFESASTTPQVGCRMVDPSSRFIGTLRDQAITCIAAALRQSASAGIERAAEWHEERVKEGKERDRTRPSTRHLSAELFHLECAKALRSLSPSASRFIPS